MMNWRPGAIPGVWRRTIALHPDERGSFAELWRASWTEALPTTGASVVSRQANVSRSQPLGFAWDDPDAAVPWPDREPIHSPRDASARSLADLRARWRR